MDFGKNLSRFVLIRSIKKNFIKAILLDFSTSFGRSTEDDFIEADPTRPSEELISENRTSGILGLARQKGWLTKVG